MSQVTWRAPDELVERVRRTAMREGRSLNEYLTRLARAATDPEFAGSDVERLRERLSQAGLIAPAGAIRRRPDPEEARRARREAGHGTSLSDLLARERG